MFLLSSLWTSCYKSVLGNLGLVDVDAVNSHGSSPLLLHPYASASDGTSYALSSSSFSSANHYFLQHHQQQQQQRQSYHQSVFSSPLDEVEGGGPVPVIEFLDDEIFRPISFLRSPLTFVFGFDFELMHLQGLRQRSIIYPLPDNRVLDFSVVFVSFCFSIII